MKKSTVLLITSFSSSCVLTMLSFLLDSHIAIIITSVCAAICAMCGLILVFVERSKKMTGSKYKSQIKNLREKYVRFPLDLKPEILDEFKKQCNSNNTTPTTEIKKFIINYINTHKNTD